MPTCTMIDIGLARCERFRHTT